MANEIVAFAQAKAKAAVRRAAVPAAFALTGGLFVLFAITGLFSALFFWLEPDHGPVAASLILTAVALVLALLAFAPLVFRRRPPPQQDAMLPQFVSRMARAAPGLGPRQLVVTAALLAVALVFTGRGQKK